MAHARGEMPGCPACGHACYACLNDKRHSSVGEPLRHVLGQLRIENDVLLQLWKGHLHAVPTVLAKPS